MKNSILSFQKSINNIISSLEHTIDKLELFDEISSRKHNSKKIESKLVRKTDSFVTNFANNCSDDYSKFIYNGSIISIYGSLERLVEDLIEACVHNISLSTNDYENLHSSIRKNHVEFSFNLASKISKDRNIDSSHKLKKQKEIVENLQGCFNNTKEFILNKRAFSVHTANFRYDIIRESFSNIGMSEIFSEIIDKNDSFTNLIKTDLGFSPAQVVEKVQLESHLREKLNELAIRRNQIAHGGTPESYLNYSLLLNFAKFILFFGEALHQYCSDYIDYYKIINIDFSEPSFICLGNPMKIFRKNNILGIVVTPPITLQNKVINKDSEIYLVNENSRTKVIKDKIESIFLDNNEVNSHTITAPFEMGIKINKTLSDKYTNRKIYIKVP
ncbi:hypothetical protein DM586_00500 [Vibrio fluvialis]|uniref:HEPN domain-containing protein n=1 Tax=Vibrio fluvialis TaxID=676 RepID=UPI00117BE9B9|nr:HEPN domain-containing protein [Vibrio fluvialis]TRN17441.1 hypothetical protein DM586_00500 [Vibrio fluvialis]